MLKILDINIYGTEDYCILHDLLLKIAISRNSEFLINECTGDTEPAKETAVYILPMNDDTIPLAVRIRSVNPTNYIIVIINSIADLAAIITPQICPSGYLLKPVGENELVRIYDTVSEDYSRLSPSDEMFRFKIKAREYSIPIKSIVCVESANKKVLIRTAVQEFECLMTLENVLAALPENFMQIHKSYVVNLNLIRNINYGEMYVEFEDGSSAYISRSYKKALKERMEG